MENEGGGGEIDILAGRKSQGAEENSFVASRPTAMHSSCMRGGNTAQELLVDSEHAMH